MKKIEDGLGRQFYCAYTIEPYDKIIVCLSYIIRLILHTITVKQFVNDRMYRTIAEPLAYGASESRKLRGLDGREFTNEYSTRRVVYLLSLGTEVDNNRENGYICMYALLCCNYVSCN